MNICLCFFKPGSGAGGQNWPNSSFLIYVYPKSPYWGSEVDFLCVKGRSGSGGAWAGSSSLRRLSCLQIWACVNVYKKLQFSLLCLQQVETSDTYSPRAFGRKRTLFTKFCVVWLNLPPPQLLGLNGMRRVRFPTLPDFIQLRFKFKQQTLQCLQSLA